jgi:hypothetical protein
VADFCSQCSEEVFGEDFKDLAGLLTPEQAKEGFVVPIICEGCGPVFVDIDGKCVDEHCLKKHGTNG